jgi:hypothetical protein
MRKLFHQPVVYRLIAVLSLAVVIALALAMPNHLMEPDDWAYY